MVFVCVCVCVCVCTERAAADRACECLYSVQRLGFRGLGVRNLGSKG